ncbi:MAG: ABC transporter substrate-binding protein [bacterium]|nr:ABC transporter substrate-binding protein [bacterium]
MKRSIMFLAGVLVALAIAGGVSLTTAQNSLDDLLRIGVLVQSGSALDESAYEAALLAASDINSADDEGVVAPDNTRYGFEVLRYDVTTADDVADALAEAVEDDVVALIGPHDSGLAAALDDAGTPAVPVLLTASDGPSGSYLYTLAPDDAAWAEAAADYLANVRQFDRIALLTNDTTSAETAREAFLTATEDSLIVADVQVDVEATSFEAQAQTIRDSEAQALFVWALDGQMLALQEALEALRWEGIIVYAGLDADTAAQLDAAHASKTFGLANWTSAAYDERSQSFARDYAAQTSADATDVAALAYDAVSLIAAAVDNNGANAANIANWISSSGALEGVAGRYAAGVSQTVRLFQISEGATLEAAVYEAGECRNCPALYAADVSEEDVTDSATLRIGLLLAGDTPNQSLAERIEQAAQLAIREVNTAGGIIDPNGTRYTLSLNVYEVTNAAEAETAMQEAAEDGVSVILGPDYNGQILTNLDDAENAAILQFTSATSDSIARNEASGYVYQLRTTDGVLAAATADYLVNTRGFSSLATVHVNTDYGMDSADAFSDAVSATDDGEIVLALEHEVAETDMSAIAAQIAASGAETVAVWSPQPAAQALLEALAAEGWDGVIAYGYLTPGFVEASTVWTGELVGAVSWWAVAEDWTSRDFAARYAERYNDAPVPQSAAYYDAVYLISHAVRENGAQVSDMQTWLEAQDSFIGVQGSYAPETYSTSELTRTVLIVQAQGGQVSEISRYNAGVCLSQCEE